MISGAFDFSARASAPYVALIDLNQNARDDAIALREALEGRFSEVEVEIVGCAALFSGRV